MLIGGLGWFGFLGSPCPRACYFRVSLKSQTTGPRTTNSPLVESTSLKGIWTDFPQFWRHNRFAATVKRGIHFITERCEKGYNCNFCHIEHDKKNAWELKKKNRVQTLRNLLSLQAERYILSRNRGLMGRGVLLRYKIRDPKNGWFLFPRTKIPLTFGCLLGCYDSSRPRYKEWYIYI